MDSRIEDLIDFCFSLGQGGWNEAGDKAYYKAQALEKAKELKLHPLPGPAFAGSSPEYEPDYAFTREEQIGKFMVDANDLEVFPMGDWKKILQVYESSGRMAAMALARGAKSDYGWTVKKAAAALDRVIYREKT